MFQNELLKQQFYLLHLDLTVHLLIYELMIRNDPLILMFKWADW